MKNDYYIFPFGINFKKRIYKFYMSGKISLTAETKYELLKEISDRMRDTLELDEILNNLLDALQNIIEHDASGIFVLSRDIAEHPHYHFPKQYIAGLAKRGFDELPLEEDEMLSLGKGLIGHVINSGESLVIPDVNLDSRYIAGRKPTRSEIVVPIMKNGRAIGALDVESDKPGAFNHTDLEILNFFADAASLSIEKALLHHQILEKKKVEKQLQIAGEVQSRLLPQNPPVAKGYDFAGLCIPTYEIGGDYFDYIQIDKNKIGIAIADISGDGIPAALIMTAFRALLRSQVKRFRYPSELMYLLNAQLTEFTRKKDFVTAFYGILDLQNHSFVYTNCGHNPPLLFRANGKFEMLDKGGPSLCIVDSPGFRHEKILLDAGDRLVLYTDGVTEIFNNNSEEFGLERLRGVIVSAPDLRASALLEKIVRETKNFSQSEYYRDDYTLVIVNREHETEIIDYIPDLKIHFRELNHEWLNKFFTVEKEDEFILDNPGEYIINKGGFILFARMNNVICGTVAANKLGGDVYEISKMAVTENYRGKGIGKKLAVETIERIKKLGAKKIVLETNRKLETAYALYLKLGFREIDYDSENKTRYERPTIKMELTLK
jgi:serine phosphatase RsbU (regulator of sigma subunit)/GNAT superfamily N-acetyltransferase